MGVTPGFGYTIEQPKLHAGHMEVAVADLINYRVHTIVPNVSWGLHLNHECDMLILDSKNRFTEVEIKVTLSDLKADFKKKHKHSSKIISRLIYAVPEKLKDVALELIPPTAGLIVVKWEHFYYKASWVKTVNHDKKISPPSDKIIKKFYQLGCMRIWSLKSHNNIVRVKPKTKHP